MASNEATIGLRPGLGFDGNISSERITGQLPASSTFASIAPYLIVD